ncbi:patatin-like phospholipase family protein [uncultured Hoeflea sp.]|uniref:patatin-like phospholipase family protein n=1 Tax=uncultured Hoeflea sp. TaxID=538666 RepID=UPI0030DC4E39
MSVTFVEKEKTVLVLQGGGALGAYQAGAYEALSEAGYEPSWIAGISIGAINGAIIAGNVKENRVSKLRAFWETTSSSLLARTPFAEDKTRSMMNEVAANWGMVFGIVGFFKPRLPYLLFGGDCKPDEVSFYDTSPLRDTLSTLIDFDYLNSAAAPRLSVGAVDVQSGNFAYFDARREKLATDHVMASGALPPGFPPVLINGRYYWDGGLVSNTPLDYVMEYSDPEGDLCIFQVDVFSARGEMPKSIMEINEREKDIRFSSRTRFNSDHVRVLHELRFEARKLLETLPKELSGTEHAKRLTRISREATITIAHIIRRDTPYELGSKDYEFSRQSVEEHWELGRNNVRQGLRSNNWSSRGLPESGFQVFDLTQ